MTVAMITVTRLNQDEQLVVGGEELLGASGLVWIDVEAHSEEQMADLARRFHLHPLAVEDTLHLDQRPKLEEYPEHYFLVLHSFSAGESDPCQLTLHEVHMFIRPEWIITVHEHPVPVLPQVRSRFAGDPANTFGRGVDFVIYAIADGLVDANWETVDRVEGEIEALEEQILEGPETWQLERMSALRHSMVTLRRVLSPQRDTMSQLSRGGVPFVRERTLPYFRDVFDHLLRLHEQIEAARDFLGNAREVWLSMVANRTNEVSKRLTLIATIFLPLSFITGFFGQNFAVLSRPIFFWSMIVLVVGVPPALLVWFWRKQWL